MSSDDKNSALAYLESGFPFSQILGVPLLALFPYGAVYYSVVVCFFVGHGAD